MPNQSLQHNTPTFSTRNINPNSPTSLPSPYNSPILASDLMAFPAGGIKNANTLDELRRALNQIAKDKKAYLDKLQVQVTNNDGDIAIIHTNLTEIQADLVNVARDLSRKAWESIVIVPGIGLSAPHGISTEADEISGSPTGVSLAGDLQLDLDVATDSEIGGVLSNDAQTITNTTAEAAINGHIEVDASGNVKIKDNAIELGAKTRGDYIKNITANTPDGIVRTNGQGESAITDLKLADIHSGASEQLATVTDANVTGHAMPNGKIRRVTLQVPTRDKFGRITSDSPLKINSANDKNLKVLVTTGLNITAGSNLGASTAKSATFKQNKGFNQDFTINHSPAVSALQNTTFESNTPTSGYDNYVGFGTGADRTGAIVFPETLGAITFDTLGHVTQVTKRTLTYGLDSPMRAIGNPNRPYAADEGHTFDLNVPTEADFNHLVGKVLALQEDRVLIPNSPLGVIQLERNSVVTGGSGAQGDLGVYGNLNVGDSPTGQNYVLSTSKGTRRVGINKPNPTRELDVTGRIKIDATSKASMAGTIDNGHLVIDGVDSQNNVISLGIDPNQIRTNTDLILQAPSSNKSIQLETAAGETLRVTSGGRVGIGTGAPVKKFQVVGSSDDAVSASFSGGIEVANTVHNVNGGNRAFGFLSIDNDRAMVGGNLRLDDTVTAGTHPGYATGTNDRGGAGIVFENANDDSRGEIRFVQKNDTNDGTWNVLERVVIDHLGRVGIGTATPGARLHVKAPTPGDSNEVSNSQNDESNSPSAIFDTTVVCEGNLVVKGDFNLTNGITFDGWNLQQTTGAVTATGTQHFVNTLQSTAINNGAVRIDGGVGIAKNLNVGGNTQLGNDSGDTVGMGMNQLVFGQMGPDNLYGIAYGGGTGTQDDVLNDSPFYEGWRIYHSKSMPGNNESGTLFEEYIHTDGIATSSLTNPANDYLVFEKQDSNQQFTDGGFVFIANGSDQNNNDRQRSKKLLRIKENQAKFYQNVQVDGTLSIAGGLTTTGSSGLTLSGNTGLTGNLTVNGNTTLGDATTDTTTVSGDFTAGNSGAADANKLFFDTSAGRLGIGKTNPTYPLDVAGHGRFVGDVISSGSSGAEFTASYGSGKVMRLLHGSGYGVVGTTGETKVAIRTNDTDRITVLSTGQVGIGVTTPNTNYKLTVNGNTRSEGNIFVGGADFDLNSSPRRTLENNSDTTHEEPSESTRRRALVHEFGDTLNINYGNDYTGGLRIGNHSIFTNTGNLGVGKSSNPNRTIHAYEATGQTRLCLQSGDGSEVGIDFSDSGDLDVGRITYSHSNDYMSFFTNSNNRMTLTNNGRLGIGNNNPRGTLEVSGGQYISGSAPEIIFNETGNLENGNPVSGLDNHGYYRLIVNEGAFRINRNTHDSNIFDSQDDAFICHHNGNVSVGSINSVPYNDGTNSGTVNYRPLSINVTHSSDPTDPERAYIQSSLPRFIVGSNNIFNIQDTVSSEQRMSFATRANSNSDIPIRTGQNGQTNYANDVIKPGDDNDSIGFAVVNTDAGQGVNGTRGTTVYVSKNKGKALCLNRNNSGGTIQEFRRAGVKMAAFDVGNSTTAGATRFSIKIQTVNNGFSERMIFDNSGEMHVGHTTITNVAGGITFDGPTLTVQSSKKNYIQLQTSTGTDVANISYDGQTDGLIIANQAGADRSQKIRLRPDNSDGLVLTAAECDIKSTSTKVKTLSSSGGISANGTVSGTKLKANTDILIQSAVPFIMFDDTDYTGDAPYITGNSDYGNLNLFAPSDGAEVKLNASGSTRLWAGKDVAKDKDGMSSQAGVKIGGDLWATGDVSADGDVAAAVSSDRRLKDNITPIEDAISKVNKLSGNTFDWNDKARYSGSDVGVIAQEVQELIPSAVKEREDGYLKVEYTKIIPLLIESIKELSAKVKELESKIN